jgi:hypothetical protein
MTDKTSLIVTSISAPNPVLKSLASGAVENNVEFIVIGDVPSPKDFYIEGCNFFGLEDQAKMDFKLAEIIPTRHYARKNLGYLHAIQNGTNIILETDDDNFPRKEFWDERKKSIIAEFAETSDWLNAYQFFTDSFIWPRGFTLEKVLESTKFKEDVFIEKELNCPIQQGLADDNPDVDAIFRLTYELPITFEKQRKIALGKNTWCPFNSQNTTWFKEAFPLLYLPSYCSFRMTDIWRSYIAQRILWENDSYLLFHEATVYQERNEHDLMKDFRDEIPGYVNNKKIVESLQNLSLKSGKQNMGENLYMCYEKLVSMDLVGKEELPLIEAWNSDINSL